MCEGGARYFRKAHELNNLTRTCIMKKHEIEITEAARSLTASLKESLWSDEHEAMFVEIEFFRSHFFRDRFICELTVTCDGPTVIVKVDQHGKVRLHHSWGVGSDGERKTEWELPEELASTWREYVEQVSTSYYIPG